VASGKRIGRKPQVLDKLETHIIVLGSAVAVAAAAAATNAQWVFFGAFT